MSAVHIPPVLPLSSLHTAGPLNILPWKNPLRRRYRPSPTPQAKNTLPRPPLHSPSTPQRPASAAAAPPNCLRLFIISQISPYYVFDSFFFGGGGDFLPHYITSSSCLSDKLPPKFPHPPSQMKKEKRKRKNKHLSPAPTQAVVQPASLWSEPADQPVRSAGRLTHEFLEESREFSRSWRSK